MSDSCCTPEESLDRSRNPLERRVLWIALAINATMFAAELVAGAHAGSSAVQADSLDFLADASNYAVSLLVVGAGAMWRARAALAKGLSMAGLGAALLLITALRFTRGQMPQAEVMGVVGVLAIGANLFVLRLLTSFRRGDANRRAVWICTRNDVIGNVAVLLAATGVVTANANWPDALVASGMAILGIWGGIQIIRSALEEQATERVSIGSR